ncbi:MAG TPA: hypothetical protein VIG38_07495 [Hyphomicrobium sp.]|jgi:hypothetical protein
MAVTGIFDALFVNQLFGTNERGETVFYPNGLTARGYLVPAEREASVRSGVRRLALMALVGAIVFAVLLPRAIEAWWGFTLPLGWFIGYVLVATVAGVAALIRALSRLTAGLAPV